MCALNAVPIERLRIAAVLFALCTGAAAFAQSSGKGPIYTCTDAAGKRLTSDRPIAECNAREQRVLNADGSVKRIVPPPMTADERSDAEARERDATAEHARQQEAVRRDRNLLARYPSEAAHRKARELALEDLHKALRVSEARMATLAAERKPLADEAEFYVGKTRPLKLQIALDANDASAEAQKSLMQNQRVEALRIELLYDAELERLKKLWSGAQPGSLGVLAGVAPAASAPRKK